MTIAEKQGKKAYPPCIMQCGVFKTDWDTNRLQREAFIEGYVQACKDIAKLLLEKTEILNDEYGTIRKEFKNLAGPYLFDNLDDSISHYMSKEKLCPFEVAKLLKERGFNEDTLCYYREVDGELNIPKETYWYDWNSRQGCISAPTQQAVTEWLRKNHNKHCQVGYDIQLEWYYDIIDLKETVSYDYEEMKCHHNNHSFDSCWDATEDAIEYCLKNLI